MSTYIMRINFHNITTKFITLFSFYMVKKISLSQLSEHGQNGRDTLE